MLMTHTLWCSGKNVWYGKEGPWNGPFWLACTRVKMNPALQLSEAGQVVLFQKHLCRSESFTYADYFILQVLWSWHYDLLLLLFSRSIVSDSFATQWTVVRQAPLSTGFSSKNTGVGCHFLLQGIFLTSGSSLQILHWQGHSLLLSH